MDIHTLGRACTCLRTATLPFQEVSAALCDECRIALVGERRTDARLDLPRVRRWWQFRRRADWEEHRTPTPPVQFNFWNHLRPMVDHVVYEGHSDPDHGGVWFPPLEAVEAARELIVKAHEALLPPGATGVVGTAEAIPRRGARGGLENAGAVEGKEIARGSVSFAQESARVAEVTGVQQNSARPYLVSCNSGCPLNSFGMVYPFRRIEPDNCQ